MTEVWHISSSLLSQPAKEVLSALISDDKKNYEKAEQEFSDDLKLLDDALALYISAIQGAYTVKERWQHQSTTEAPIILLSSVLNILLLIRHAILLGYFSETPALFRNCHERITRSYLFWLNESEASRFLSGKPRTQEEIDDKLSALGEPKEKGKRAAYIALRKQYKHQSEMTHPTLASFKFRYGDIEPDKLKEKILDSPILGGFLSNDLFKPVVYSALQITLFAISIIKLIFVDSSGSYEDDYKKILEQYNEWIKKISPKMV
ncbi:MAG: hypothetical protein HYY41_05765, partial [Chloroflexi bacterium]|nr:hypothetical protein [Chloroflexota bacterium]